VEELLQGSEECFTAEEIHARLRATGRRIGLATVYRSVNLLSETGAIQRIDAGDGKARYEAAERDPTDHHHHLICRSCHRVLKYAQFSEEELELMNRTERRLSERFGFRITGHRIYFEGVCPDCLPTQ
jgi:Fur family ferric uptake transcriptional regulator